MLDYMARQAVLFYLPGLVVVVLVATYQAVTGEWVRAAVLVIVAVLGSLQYAFARWWIRTGEDNDARQWLQDHPDWEPGDPPSDRA